MTEEHVSERTRARDDSGAEMLLRELRSLPRGDPRGEVLRAELVRMHIPIARGAARRYSRRGEPLEDIEQAAYVGLVKAINRYDPELSDRFLSYASPLINGEIKRHFRDKTWPLHVPRRLQELRPVLRQASRDFTREHGRSPTVPEVATLIGISEEETIEVMGAAEAYTPASLDAPVSTEDDAAESLYDLLGADDGDLDTAVDVDALWPLVDELPERERDILMMRFFGNKTQAAIAAEIGISQMHVSRLITRTLDWLRAELLADADRSEQAP